MSGGATDSTDRGVGLISTMFAVPLVLFLLLIAAQILFRLHATAVARALAGDAARDVAISPGAAANATQWADLALRDGLGDAGPDAEIDWEVTTETIRVRVSLDAPRLLPLTALGPLADPIVSIVSVRREVWR